MKAALLETAWTRPGAVYPESDGKPIGESDVHITVILYLRQALRWLFRELHDVYVAADMLFYYEEGEPASCVCPDVFVVQGIEPRDRKNFKLWEERRAPSLVVEVTSRSSRVADLGTKKGVYEMLGVSEYLVFDPLGEYLTPRFRAFELEAGSYREIQLTETQSYQSRVLPVIFRPDGPLLRVVDAVSGAQTPLLEEATDRAEREAQRAEQEAQRAEQEAQRAEQEAHRAESLSIRLQRYREKYGDLEGE